MDQLYRQSQSAGPGRPSGLRRLGLYVLVAVHKALLCVLLLEAGVEGGFLPAAEYAQKLTEALAPIAHRDDHYEGPNSPPATRTAPVDGSSEAASPAPLRSRATPATRPSGPRPPPIG